MTRAGMLSRLVCVPTLLAVLAAGCDGVGFKPLWSRSPGKSSGPTVTSDPVRLDPPSTAPAGPALDQDNEPAGDQVAPLNKRIDDYIARFPTDDRDREGAVDSAGTSPDATVLSAPGTTADPAPRTTPTPSTEVPIGVSTAKPQPSAPTESTGTPALAWTDVGPETHRPAVWAPNMSVGVSPNRKIHAGTQASPPPPVAKPGSATPESAGPRVELISVRPVAKPALEAETSPAGPSANQPAGEFGPSPGPVDLAGMISQLERSVQQNPGQLDDQLELRLLYLATAQDEKATAAFEGVDPLQAELLSTLCQTIAAARQVIQQPDTPTSPALIAAADLHRLMEQRSSVIIPKIALVTRVNSYGDYDSVTPRFAAGRPLEVFLYAEVANFRSEPTGDGRIRTLLSETVEIFDSAGKIVWQQSEPEIEDRVLSPRRDFFIPFPISLPASTPPGEYILKVAIEDRIGATTDQQRMTFTIE